MENLRYLLSQYDPQKPVYLGHLFKPYHKLGYMSGGASYVISRQALKLLVEEGYQKVRNVRGVCVCVCVWVWVCVCVCVCDQIMALEPAPNLFDKFR